MIRCYRFKKLLMRYVEGAIETQRKLELQEHVEECSSCARELDELQFVSRALKDADIPAVEPAPDLWLRVQSAIAAPSPRQRPWWQVKSFHIASAAGVAVAMLLAVLAVRIPLPQGENVTTEQTAQSPTDQEKRTSTPQQNVGVPETAWPPTRAATGSAVRKREASRDTRAPAAKTIARVAAVPKREPTTISLPQRTVSRDQDAAAGLVLDTSREREAPAESPASPALTPHPPFYQMGRAPGGAQKPEMLEKAQSETYTAAPAPPAGPARGEPGADVELKDKQDKGVRVAAAPSAATGAATNVSPPLISDSRKDAPPTKPVTYGSLGIGHSRSKEHKVTSLDQSIRENEGALASRPNDVKTMQVLADAYEQKGLKEKRIDMLERIAKARSEDARNWLALGKAYVQAGRKDKAKEAFTKAMEKGDDAVKREAAENLRRLDS